MKNIHAFTNKSATVPHKLAFSVLRKQHFQGQISNHSYSPLPFHVSEPVKRRRCLGWNQWENLARFPRNVFQGGKTLPGFRGTFSQAGKPCPVSEEHFPGRENLARLQGNVFPGGKTLPGSWGTFSRAGKACRTPREHFPKQENLAALRGNIFPGGKSLPRSAAGFQRSYVRRRLPLFAHIRAYAIRPYSFWRNTKYKRHHPSPYPQRINGKYVGTQGHTPFT